MHIYIRVRLYCIVVRKAPLPSRRKSGRAVNKLFSHVTERLVVTEGQIMWGVGKCV